MFSSGIKPPSLRRDKRCGLCLLARLMGVSPETLAGTSHGRGHATPHITPPRSSSGSSRAVPPVNPPGPLVSATPPPNVPSPGNLSQTLKHISGLSPTMGSTNLFLFFMVFILAFAFSYILIIIFIPLLQGLDRGLIFGLGGLIQDISVGIIFLLVLLFGIIIIFSGFALFYSAIDIQSFTGVFFKNVAILFGLDFLAAFSDQRTDVGTNQVIAMYFYLLIILASILAWLGIVNSLPRMFIHYLHLSQSDFTTSFLLIAITFVAIIGPALFVASTLQTADRSADFIFHQMSVNYQIDVSDPSVTVSDLLLTSLSQNSSSFLTFRLIDNGSARNLRNSAPPVSQIAISTDKTNATAIRVTGKQVSEATWILSAYLD